ncbi:MAG: bacterioferritin [Deltaproteobacteria bacterium]|nr:bacterioferritin [Deltaproteobacteria bacterium]
MKTLDLKKTRKLLSRIMEFELAGVVRYTHYSLMIFGPNRIPIVQFMKQQASESLLHAQTAGELLTGLGGHPTLRIAEIPESYKHSVQDILEESREHEGAALDLYKEFLDTVVNRSVYLEEFARTQIGQEEMHGLELRKMLRDIGAPGHAPSPPEHLEDDDAPAPDAKRDRKRRKKDRGKDRAS